MEGVGWCFECGCLASEKHEVGSRRRAKYGDCRSPFLNCARAGPRRGQRTLSFGLVEMPVT